MKFIEGPYLAVPDRGTIRCASGRMAEMMDTVLTTDEDPEAFTNTVRLLAASLEMYEALKTAEQVLQMFSDERYVQPCINEIQNALAKAEGRTDAPTD